jgi:hypothetical protein
VRACLRNIPYVYRFASVSRHTDLVGVHIRTLMEGQRGRARPHTFCIYMCVFQSQQVHRSIMPFHGDKSLW